MIIALSISKRLTVSFWSTSIPSTCLLSVAGFPSSSANRKFLVLVAAGVFRTHIG